MENLLVPSDQGTYLAGDRDHACQMVQSGSLANLKRNNTSWIAELLNHPILATDHCNTQARVGLPSIHIQNKGTLQIEHSRHKKNVFFCIFELQILQLREDKYIQNIPLKSMFFSGNINRIRLLDTKTAFENKNFLRFGISTGSSAFWHVERMLLARRRAFRPASLSLSNSTQEFKQVSAKQFSSLLWD